ncbi:MAG: hypothetical protein MJ127_06135 [Mogibacterium sp.]|nr:hypothetical protein [Mogibacterium sp.]
MKRRHNGQTYFRYLTALLMVVILTMTPQNLMVHADSSAGSISVAFEGSDFEKLVGRDDDCIIRLTGSQYCGYKEGWSQNCEHYEGIQLIPSYADNEVDEDGSSGGAFITKGLKSDSDFALAFSVFMGDSRSANDNYYIGDGFCFVIAADNTSIGSQGGGMGYQGINKSIGIEFDTFHNDNMDGWDWCTHCDYHINGNTDSPNQIVDIDSLWGLYAPDGYVGIRVYCWMEYDANSHTLYARFNRENTRPTDPTMTIKDINVKDIVGDTCHLGITAAEGWADQQIVLESLYYDSKSSTPISIGEEYVAEIAHEHSFTYSASGNVITATCNAAGCYLTGNKTTLTLTYDMTSKTVGYATGEAGNWKAETGGAAPEIAYYLSDGTTLTTAANSGASGSGKAPVNSGTYVAKATVGDATAKLSFTLGTSGGGGNTDLPSRDDLELYVSEDPSIINYSDGYIHYDAKAPHVILYAKEMTGDDFSKFGEENKGVYIDLTDETFVSSFGFKYYSTNNGGKWINATKIEPEKLSKLFSKNIDIRLTDKLDAKGKHPAEDAVVYGFDTIRKRPSTPTLKVDFCVARDEYGITNGQWMLMSRAYSYLDNLDKYEIKISDEAGADFAMDMTGVPEGSEGKFFSDYAAFTGALGKNAWGRWPSEGGVWVPGLSNEGRPRKAKIEVRIAAAQNEDGYTAASKSKKLTVSSVSKVPTVKANYQKEEIRFKKGMTAYFGTVDSIKLNANGVPDFYRFPSEKEDATYEDYAGTAIVNSWDLGVKKAITIAPYLTGERNTIILWQNATRKKPASALQTIKLEARYVISEDNIKPIEVKSGKVKLPEGFVIVSENGNMIKSVPSVSASEVFEICYKADAKGGKETEDGSTYATSNSAYMAVFYGTYKSGTRDRNGVEKSEIFLTREEAEAAIAQWDAAKTTE